MAHENYTRIGLKKPKNIFKKISQSKNKNKKWLKKVNS